MATLVPTTQKLVDAFEHKEGEKFSDYIERSEAAFENLLSAAKALPDGEVVGAIISFPWADGQAWYRVACAKPLKLEHIPYGDAWHADHITIRGLRLEDVKRKVH